MVRTQEVRDSRVMESHAELQQAAGAGKKKRRRGGEGRQCTVGSDGQDSRSL